MRIVLGTGLLLASLLSSGLHAEDVKPVAPPPDAKPPGAEAVPPKGDSPFKTPKDKLSYCIGVVEGHRVKSLGDQVDLKIVLQGMQDTNTGKPLMEEAEVKETLMKWQQEMMAKQQKEQAKMMEEQAKAGIVNKKAGDDFLAANKAKPGVVTTASGLQYKEERPGTGASPKATDTVVVHYKGTTLDGAEFDSSYKRKEPATFRVDEVIKGWTEALQLMKTGSKFTLWIPSNLAYGEQAQGEQIGANSMLTFEVELLEVKGGATPPPAPVAPETK